MPNPIIIRHLCMDSHYALVPGVRLAWYKMHQDLRPFQVPCRRSIHLIEAL